MAANIDIMQGRELDAAVARALGCNAVLRGGHLGCECVKQAPYPHAGNSWNSETPFYSRDIAAAWTLDGEDYLWDHYDVLPMDRPGFAARVTVNAPAVDRCEATVYYDDKTQKSEAYATAHCRAWLKAKQAEAANG
jgi:hypothetical protein